MVQYRIKAVLILMGLLFSHTLIFAQNGVTYDPPIIGTGEAITIIFDPAQNNEMPDNIQQCTLHWGINSTGSGWTVPPSSSWPQGTVLFGNEAVRSPMKKDGSLFKVTIQTNETFKTIDFVFNDGTPSALGVHWAHDLGGQDWHFSAFQSWTPAFPNHNDTITIRFSNLKQGGCFHWGVNATGRNWTAIIPEYLPPGSIMQGVAARTRISPDANGKCNLKIGPFNRGKQVIKTVDYAINWDDGSWDNNNSTDYHIYFNFNPRPGDPSVHIIHPDSDATFSSTEPVLIDAEASNAVGVQFWVEGQLLAQIATSPFQTTWLHQNYDYGKHELAAMAYDQKGLVNFDLITIWIMPQVIEEPAPMSIQYGAWNNGDGTVTYGLFAPGKKFISLVGDFNGWSKSANILKKSPDGWWWLTRNHAPGKYSYQYLVDNELQIGDPFAIDIEWKKLEGGEDWESYETAKAIIQVGGADFAWSDSNFTIPASKDMIIYEMHVGDFTGTNSGGGTFLTAIKKLDYLDSLGINAIELMPVNEFPGEISWGYNPVFYIAPESAYGTPEEFKQLVNEAHKRGIAVILDVVLNHSEGRCPLYLLYENINENPWYHDYHPPFSWADWGPEFDHDRPATQQVTDFILKTWIEEFHIDGFRIDVAWGLADPYQNSQSGSLKRKAVLGRICEQVAQHNPNLFIVAEYFPPDVGMEAYIVEDTRLDAMWHDTFHWGMKDMLKPNISVDQLNEAVYFAGKWHNGYFTDAGQVVNYTTSHDEQRTIYEFVTYQSGDYATGVRLEKATGAVLLTAAGTPMLYHGQEFGQDTPKTLNRNPLKWNFLNDPAHRGIYNYYRRLIWLRQNLKVLRSNNYQTLHKHYNQTFVYQRADANEQVIVAVNFHRNKNDVMNIQFPHTGPWYEFITDDSVEVNAANVLENYEIPYASARIFVNKRAWKNLDIPTDPTFVNAQNMNSIIDHFDLAQNYPNPFNASTMIQYCLSETKPTQTIIKILNILGQEIKTLAAEKQSAGDYRVTWDGLDNSGKSVSSGVYLYSIRSGKYLAVKKLVLLK